MDNKNNKKNTSETRSHLLKAANALILSEGVAHLTLEAVAQRAGVSKGGLLYHFPSKEALIEGLVNQLAQDFEQELERKLAAEPVKPNRWLRAYIRASFEPGQSPADIDAGLLAAINLNPELLAGVRQTYKEWQQRLEQESTDPVLATLIRLATDGLWLAELLDLGAPNAILRQQVIVKLLELSGGEK